MLERDRPGPGILAVMAGIRDAQRGMPLPVRWAVVGAVLVGGLGAVTGLIVGLVVHAPTAWAATVEVAVPSAALGLVLGLVAGSARLVARRRHGADGGRAVSPGTSPRDP